MMLVRPFFDTDDLDFLAPIHEAIANVLIGWPRHLRQVGPMGSDRPGPQSFRDAAWQSFAPAPGVPSVRWSEQQASPKVQALPEGAAWLELSANINGDELPEH